MLPTEAVQRSKLRRILPSAARTRIIGWMLLFLIVALAVATFATWRLLVSAIDTRMDEALRVEVQEFAELVGPGIDPGTGEPFTGVEELIRDAMAYNIARPNEVFLGYVDGSYLTKSPQQPGTPTCWPVIRPSLSGSLRSPSRLQVFFGIPELARFATWPCR